MRTVYGLTLGLLMAIGTARAASQEHIGSWVLSCPADKPCVLRLDKRFLDKGGLTGDLEVEAMGTSLVPVLVLRGLPSELMMAAALSGRADASVQLGGGPKVALGCAASSVGYMCSPDRDAARALAAGLPGARSLKLRVEVSVTGLKPLPVQERSLDLMGTSAALDRLRAVGASQVPGPLEAVTSQSPAALLGMADKALRAAGYPNGVADLQGLVAKYRGK
jgi:hypothetical protein